MIEIILTFGLIIFCLWFSTRTEKTRPHVRFPNGEIWEFTEKEIKELTR